MTPETADPATLRRLYGRRQGHALRKGQAALVEDLLPQVTVPDEGPLTATGLFGGGRPLWLEIGFGAGEHLASQAAANPHVGLIGCEPFLNGVVGALNHIRDENLDNVRLYMGDALDVLDRLAPASLDRAFLLHPDPWPKARHAKRRFVNPGPLDVLASRLKPGAELRIGTDHPIYLRWTLMQMAARSDFEWCAATAANWQTRPADWPPTRYEAKARRLGHEVWYLRYRRI
ncbi:tRNA (guanine(46)-N(7))-methyltransferase TrmB [Glacieibacterium frigidum]|uniref:tRNA (guanine-N(7)-)-methyltransferase n=1 Tax=Glacieibacterium frigidum TaxID=2593303 RepID=A0A552UEX1_9SPHN|nr:tRNA (guanine(46)-N(7))-methyltransferase TrmB [Glacieibacterium frigidum]TRW16776.1 tRNA (guanosine(46)-N7)-methyltransferase TrmB [Glacieibacterium frigidum]